MRGDWLVLGALACALPALAQQPQSGAAGPRFQVSGYAVEGRVLLRSEDFTRVVSPYVGRGKSAADIERARSALQETYHNLGHCTVKVTLAQPEPRDGMVTFVLAEALASEVRDCLPTVVLDETATRRPAASAAASAGTTTAYSYADPRDPAAPALKPRAAPVSAVSAAAPSSEGIGPVASAPAGAAPVPPAARAAAVETGKGGAAQGVAIAPYVEGAGSKGLNLLSDTPAPAPVVLTRGQDAPATVVVPVPLAEAKAPTVASAAAVPSGEPSKSAAVTPAPAVSVAEAKPPAAALVGAMAEPVKPVPATPAAAASPTEPKPPVAAPVVALVEPVKPVPATPAAAVAPAEAKPPVAAAVVAAAGPAKPAPAVSSVDVKASAAPLAVAAEPAKPAPVPALAEAKQPTASPGASPFVGTGAVVAEPQPASAAPAPAAKPAVAQPVAVVAQAEPAKPAPPAAALPGDDKPPVVVAQAAPAIDPGAPVAPKFDITRYSVEGNTLLKPESVDRVLAPFAGAGKDFGDVQRALEALQLAYQKEGWGGVEIRLPEQELDKGEVKLRVIEPRIAKITIEGNEHFSEANIRRSVPGLREGETPNSREIGKGIRLANENPAKQSAVLLRASEREDQLDATIRVADVDPKRYSVSLDNTGNQETHRLRLGLAFQNANMFGRDHVLTGQFITSPENPNDVLVAGIGYRIPFYSTGDSIDLVAGYSNVDSGTVQNLFVVAGAGTVFALRYNQNLPRWGDLEHRLSYGLDYRSYQNDVTPVGGTFKLVPDITVHPFSLNYSGSWKAEGKGDLSYYLSMVQNIPGGSDGQDDDFKQVGVRFPEGTAGYRLFRTGASYSRPIGADWQARIRIDGQYTDDALVAGEMFGIGGADSVRGFNERYVSNDKGYRTSWEIYTPDMAKSVGVDGRLRLLAFYDQGVVRRNYIQPGEVAQQSLDTAGVGLRFNYKTNLTLRLDVAYVYHDGTSTNGKDGQTKAHFALAWVWQ